MNKISKFIAVFIILILAGCTSQDEYVIGWVGALSGSATQWGEPALKATSIAIEDINSNGGVNGNPLRLIVEDSQSNGGVTATAVTKLINVNEVKIIFTHSSTESISAAPIAESNKVILFASATSTPDLTNAGDYIFRVTPVNKEGELLADTLNNGNYERIAVLTEQAKYPVGIRDAFLKNLEKQVVFDDQYQPGEMDVSTEVLKIKNSDPDAIVLLPFGMNSMIELIKTLREQGVSAEIFGNAAFNTPELIEELGESAEGIQFSSLYIDEQDERVVSFVERYEDLHGAIPNKAHTLDAATKIYIILDALEKCGEDTNCIKKFLYNVKERKTVSGTLTIDENGDADKEFVLVKI